MTKIVKYTKCGKWKLTITLDSTGMVVDVDLDPMMPPT